MATLPTLPAQAAYDEARAYASESLSEATKRAYRSDWNHFTDWCASVKLAPLPAAPETVAAYLAVQGKTHARATIERRLVSIGQAHKLAGHDWRSNHPTIRTTLKGMYRRHGKAQRKAMALGVDELVPLLDACPGSFMGTRDRAMFLVGFAGALRRSELVGLDAEHVRFSQKRGMVLILPRSKTDQERQGTELGIAFGANEATCPVRALRKWLHASGTENGPIFRAIRADGTLAERRLNPDAVTRILRARAEAAGLEPGATERLSFHGFRAGFVTEAYRRGLRDEEIMEHSRHRDLRTMRGYVRRAKLLSGSPTAKLGL